MDNEDIAKKLASLVQLDIDAFHAYGEVIEKVDKPLIREHLIRYRDDHARHINDLSAVIRNLGANPPDHSPDFKGFLIQGFTSLRSGTGIEGALKAMHTNEKLSNKYYDEASEWDLPVELKKIIAFAFEDEKRHIDFIEETLEEKAWLKPGPDKEIAGA